MSSNVTNIGAVSDPTYGSTPPTPTPSQAESAQATPNSPDPANLRLVIEEDKSAGCFVYKTVDWRTGTVVQQFPSEQLVKLREAQNYAAGAVISTRA